MRWTAMVAFATAASLGSPLLGCGDTGPAAKRLQEKFSETWDAMKTWGVEKKDDFVKGAAPKLEELSQKLAEARRRRHVRVPRRPSNSSRRGTVSSRSSTH